MTVAEDNTRIAHLVTIAYRAYRGEIPLPTPPQRKPKPPIQGFSEAAYREGLSREIEENHSSREGTLEYLQQHVRDGSLAPFTEADCLKAVNVLDSLLSEALFTESSFGDGPDAIKDLESKVPGLPKGIYSDILGYYAYVNR